MSRRETIPSIDGLYSLKVDNLSYGTTVHDLRRLFERYGDIGDVHIPRDRRTNQSRGFGFVRFYDRKDAEYAASRNDGRRVNGRDLRVTLAKYDRPVDERARDRGSRDRGSHRRYRSRSRTRSRSPLRRARSRTRSPRSRSRTRSPRSRSKSRSASRHSRSRSSVNGDNSRSRSRSRTRSRSKSHSNSRSRSVASKQSRSPTPVKESPKSETKE